MGPSLRVLLASPPCLPLSPLLWERVGGEVTPPISVFRNGGMPLLPVPRVLGGAFELVSIKLIYRYFLEHIIL